MSGIIAESIKTQNISISLEQPRFTIRNAAFAFQPQADLEWIVDKLISARSVNLFYGEPGAKKTFSLLSLAVCVALGKDWLGYGVKQRKILIVDEESGERRLTLRLRSAIRGELGDENTPIDFVSLAQFKLDNLNDAVILEALIKETGAGMVIIDALADVMDGDENSKEFMQPVFSALRKIAESTDSAIVIIHHANKNGGYRGSSAIKGSVDSLTQIESEPGSDFINFQSEKTRDGEAQDWAAKATWTDDSFYLSEAEKREKTLAISKSQAYVLRFLKEHGNSPLPDIMTGADSCSSSAARQAVYNLADAGKIKRINPNAKGQGVAAIYGLVDCRQEECEDDEI
ncbi:MAG: AAA family ATPase [Anaerolineaceae bacterium]|nr:AAA family ATPase [Anaerolineaceae bacterium]